jgi:hypothetical protein
MDFVEIDLRRDTQPVPDERQKAQRYGYAPGQRIALLCRWGLHGGGG